MYRSTFAEDQSTPKQQDGLTTKAEAALMEREANKIGLGGGVVLIEVDKTGKAAKDDRKPYILYLANGQEINAGVLKGALINAGQDSKAIAALQEQYAKMGGNGPRGINWHCTETEYHLARGAAAAVGIVVHGGGTISEGVMDIEAIGRTDGWGLPPQGNVAANLVIQIQGLPGKQAAVCNAAFLASMLEAGGEVAGNAFVAARSTEQGWRASTDTPNGGAVEIKEK